VGRHIPHLSDHLGSPRLLVNTTTGAVAKRIDYDEFGNVANDTSPGLTPFGFAGGLYDADSGMVRFGARDYDPRSGRWTTKDPIRFGGGTNFYVYAGNDPINHIDRNGQQIPANCAEALAYQAAACIDAIFDPEDIPECIEAYEEAEDECSQAGGGGGPPAPTPAPPPPSPTCPDNNNNGGGGSKQDCTAYDIDVGGFNGGPLCYYRCPDGYTFEAPGTILATSACPDVPDPR
jgi:RHS repeat-associated protein